MTSRNATGFTLIEMMITVVIIAILAAIGYPSYTRYVAETRRSDATIYLHQIAATQEKFLTECNQYTDNFGGVIVGGCTGLGMVAAPNQLTFDTPDGHYQITIALAAGGAAAAVANMRYTLTAIPQGTQASADLARCSQFTLSDTGQKLATGTDALKCWKK